MQRAKPNTHAHAHLADAVFECITLFAKALGESLAKIVRGMNDVLCGPWNCDSAHLL